MDKEILPLLYKSMVRPHLEFASCVWSPHLKYHIDAVERVQRRATKLIPEIRHLTYTERLRELDLETLEYRRKRADLIETWRILTGQHHINLNCHCQKCPEKEMFSSPPVKSTRGHSKKLFIHTSTGIRKHFFADRVASTWNKLSEATISSTTVDAFKTHLKKEIGHTAFDYRFSY